MKLSIITINRNNASGLERTISSVVSQTFDDFEYIVVDGASTDESVDVIKKYIDKISFWSSEPDSGIYNAMNKGIARASGEYCLFLNSGDRLKDTDSLVSVFRLNPTKDIIYGDQEICDGKSSGVAKFPAVLNPSYLFLDTLPHSSSFIRRNLLIDLGMYDESKKISGDHDFFLRAIVGHGALYERVPVLVSVFYTDGVSSNPANGECIRKELHESFLRYYPAFYDDMQYLYDIRKDGVTNYCLARKRSKPFRVFVRLLMAFFPVREGKKA